MSITYFERPYVCPASGNVFNDQSYNKKLDELIKKKIENSDKFFELPLGNVFKKEDLENLPSYYQGMTLKLREVPTSGSLFLEIRNPVLF